jgi:hypothetical protein
MRCSCLYQCNLKRKRGVNVYETMYTSGSRRLFDMMLPYCYRGMDKVHLFIVGMGAEGIGQPRYPHISVLKIKRRLFDMRRK